MIKEFEISTQKRYELVDVTEKIEKIVKESAIESGLVLIFTPHSTAAILLTENEAGLKEDWLKVMKKIVSGFNFLHNRIDDNADSHILSGLVNQGKVLPIENSNIIKGRWQQIFLAEFDGPRTRKVIIDLIKEEIKNKN